MFEIKALKAREILDSRGNPTIETDVWLADGSFGRASVPSGASVGDNEAIELRDEDSRYFGKGVLKAVENVNVRIAHALGKRLFHSQSNLDQELIVLDGTTNKGRLGANSILSVSLAFAKAAAASQCSALYEYIGNGRSMPRPMFNIINGGAHADNRVDIQEFMVIPQHSPSIREAIRCGAEVFHSLRAILKKHGYSTNVGDEGGFAPDITTSRQALDFIMLAIEAAGYKPGIEVAIALDAAASEFYKDNRYLVEGVPLDADGLIDYYANLTLTYPIISIEDPMSEHDHDGWKAITEVLGGKLQIVGDDVFVTNPGILRRRGIDDGVANAILIKLNQIGTLTEALAAIQLAHEHNYKTIISHRSGETEDTAIAHLAVGSGAGLIKAGSLSRTDRICKYNELIRIEESLHNVLNS